MFAMVMPTFVLPQRKIKICYNANASIILLEPIVTNVKRDLFRSNGDLTLKMTRMNVKNVIVMDTRKNVIMRLKSIQR